MTNGPQRNAFDLTFEVPSLCADLVASGDADLGIVPVAEIQRLGLPYLPDVGIACRGPVRSILLISKTRPEKIRTLAADSSSRTSVMLTRVVLECKYGCRPDIVTLAPDLQSMLQHCDAALIIGDPALKLDPEALPYQVLDLGEEWTQMTGLPMVFALWAGPQQFITAENRDLFRGSCAYGLAGLEEIVATAAPERALPAELVRRYLTHHIAFELGPKDLDGLACFWTYARQLA